MKAKGPLNRLKHHVTGAIERGEKTAIEAIVPKTLILEGFAYDIVDRVHKEIEKLKLPAEFYRRDLDGVSSNEYLLLKMVTEILLDKRPDTRGLVHCDDEDTK